MAGFLEPFGSTREGRFGRSGARMGRYVIQGVEGGAPRAGRSRFSAFVGARRKDECLVLAFHLVQNPGSQLPSLREVFSLLVSERHGKGVIDHHRNRRAGSPAYGAPQPSLQGGSCKSEDEAYDGERAEKKQEPLLDADTLHRRLLQLVQKGERAEVDFPRAPEVEEVDNQRDSRCYQAQQNERIKKRHYCTSAIGAF